MEISKQMKNKTGGGQMKNIKCLILSAALTLGFTAGIWLNAHAEGESDENEISAVQDSPDIMMSSDIGQESSFGNESQLSGDSKPEISDDAESSTESSVETSDNSDDSDNESSTESFPRSSVVSDEESSRTVTDSSAPDEQSSSFQESSSEVTEPDPSEDSSVPTESSVTVSEPASRPESAGELKHNPLLFLSGIRTVIPADRSSAPPGLVSDEEASAPEFSTVDLPYPQISQTELLPVTESAPDTVPVLQPAERRSSMLLIGIIIFSVCGMAITLSVILILRSRGEFTPSFLKFDKKKRKH